jgi:hypothetical protein
MSLDVFNSQFALDIVPGTSEKPNSIFKKKEAVQIVQAIGQFASAAPVSSMKVALRVLEQAFTEVVIKPEDWDMMQQEMTMQAQRGNSTGAPAPPKPGQNQPSGPALPGGASGGDGGAPPSPPHPGAAPPTGAGGGIPPELANLPLQVKKQVEAMHSQGLPPEQIAQYLHSKYKIKALHLIHRRDHRLNPEPRPESHRSRHYNSSCESHKGNAYASRFRRESWI